MTDTIESLHSEYKAVEATLVNLNQRLAALIPPAPPSDKRMMPRFVTREVYELSLLYISDGRSAGKARDAYLQTFLEWAFSTNPYLNAINVYFHWSELLPYATAENPNPYVTPVPAYITGREDTTWTLGDFDWFYKNPRPLPPGVRSETTVQKTARHKADLILLLQKLVEMKCFGIQLDDINTKMQKSDVQAVRTLVLEHAPSLAILGSSSATFLLDGWGVDNANHQIFTNEFNNQATEQDDLLTTYVRWFEPYPSTVTPNIGAYKPGATAPMTETWNIEETFRFCIAEGVKGGGVRNISIYAQDAYTDLRRYPAQWAAIVEGMKQFWLSRPR